MKQILILALFLAALIQGGCKKPESEDLLEMNLDDKDSQAFPFAIKSCSDEKNNSTTDSLSEASIDFGVFSFRWLGQGQLTIKTITLELKGNSLTSGKFTKTYGGTELEDTFLTTPMVIAPAADGVTPTTFTTGCGIRVGGVKFKEPESNGFAVGTLSLFGVTEDEEGSKDVLVTAIDVSVKYFGKPSGK